MHSPLIVVAIIACIVLQAQANPSPPVDPTSYSAEGVFQADFPAGEYGPDPVTIVGTFTLYLDYAIYRERLDLSPPVNTSNLPPETIMFPSITQVFFIDEDTQYILEGGECTKSPYSGEFFNPKYLAGFNYTGISASSGKLSYGWLKTISTGNGTAQALVTTDYISNSLTGTYLYFPGGTNITFQVNAYTIEQVSPLIFDIVPLCVNTSSPSPSFVQDISFTSIFH
eukprot:TRINITY_DN4534_c0_g1_i1.p1 TRINITY_DN4534_c0_g1~~TRINITY_DN4534_c0_g1_i1.p1  ORF type:complete len:226 (+),score=64.51 TRINITY_DN4534_c0_g1_i1:3-680(+)